MIKASLGNICKWERKGSTLTQFKYRHPSLLPARGPEDFCFLWGSSLLWFQWEETLFPLYLLTLIFLASPLHPIPAYLECYPTAPGDNGGSLQACLAFNSTCFNSTFPSSFWKALVLLHCFFRVLIVFSKRLLCWPAHYVLSIGAPTLPRQTEVHLNHSSVHTSCKTACRYVWGKQDFVKWWEHLKKRSREPHFPCSFSLVGKESQRTCKM